MCFMGRFGTYMDKVKLQLNFSKMPQRKKKKLSWIKRKLKNGANVLLVIPRNGMFSIAP